MNIKSEINTLQKRLLARLNVKTGSTLYIIIQEVSRQAYAKQSFVVSQKNSTLAEKCNVTASTISRNLKKIKEKCADLLTVEQNRNCREKFAALVFTFIPQEEKQDVKRPMSNGEVITKVNTDTDSDKVAKSTTSKSFLRTNYNFYQNYNKNTIVNKEKLNKEEIINDAYKKFKKQGVDKNLFNRALSEIKNKQGIRNFKAYLHKTLTNVINHMNLKNGTKVFKNQQLSDFFEILQS